MALLRVVPRSEPAEVAALIEPFLAHLERQEAAPLTRSSYKSDLVAFCVWYVEQLGEPATVENVTPTDVRTYRGQLIQEQKRAPATVNRRLAALKRFFRWTQAEGLSHDVPTDGVKGVAEASRGPAWLAPRDIDKLTRAVERYGAARDLAILWTLRHTGLRVAELAALEVSDITISERKGRLVVRHGKGGKYREVPLNADARSALRAYLAVRPESADPRLFGITSRAIELLVAKYARLAGLDRVTPHVLRHSFGKHALDAGADLVAVAALLGHAKLETTARYTRPGAVDLERAVARLERDSDLR